MIGLKIFIPRLSGPSEDRFPQAITSTDLDICVTITSYIGKGSYSKVYEGTYSKKGEQETHTCIVKCIPLIPKPEGTPMPASASDAKGTDWESYLDQNKQIKRELHFLQVEQQYIAHKIDKTVAFIIMQKAPGVNLQRFCHSKEYAAISWGRKLYMASKLFARLYKLHQNKFIHRDLSFANAFYVLESDLVTFIDYGLSRHMAFSTDGSEDEVVIDDATDYITPESFKHGYSDPIFYFNIAHSGSDILSLAAFVFGFMPQGSHYTDPDGNNRYHIEYKADGLPLGYRDFPHGLSLIRTKPRSLAPEARSDLLTVFYKCLHQCPTQRPNAQSITEILLQICTTISTPSPSSQPYTPGYKALQQEDSAAAPQLLAVNSREQGNHSHSIDSKPDY